jgi:hypothetical protein
MRLLLIGPAVEADHVHREEMEVLKAAARARDEAAAPPRQFVPQFLRAPA